MAERACEPMAAQRLSKTPPTAREPALTVRGLAAQPVRPVHRTICQAPCLAAAAIWYGARRQPAHNGAQKKEDAMTESSEACRRRGRAPQHPAWAPASGSGPGSSRASPRRRRRPPAPPSRMPPMPPIWSSEYWANKGSVKLNLWRKRVGAPQAGRAAAADAVPGARLVELDALVLRPDRAGQGRILAHERVRRATATTSGPWTTTATATPAAPATIPTSPAASRTSRPRSRWCCRRPGSSKMHFYGTSSGAIRAGAYAQAHPERVDRLVLFAFTYKGTGAPEIARRAARASSELRANNRAQARRRHDPLDLHPRRPRLDLRPGGGRGDHRRRR